MQGRIGQNNRRRMVEEQAEERRRAALRLVSAVLCLGLLCCAVPPAGAEETESIPAAGLLPDAPAPQATPAPGAALPPCPAKAPGAPAAGTSTMSPAGAAESERAACAPRPVPNWFERFLTGPEVKPLTPLEKARLAMRNVIDPFNALTILGDAAISVGADPHMAYGPGMMGFSKYVGVSLTQDITGEFFSTFLIPSIVHQDPHYHRMPNASVPRRVRHAIAQVVWTQGDNGRGMLNYGDVVGAAVQDEINNLYVPGRATNLPASASRYGIGLATAPLDNFVSEFLPDLARHIHVQVVVIQRIVNQVAKQDGPGASQ